MILNNMTTQHLVGVQYKAARADDTLVVTVRTDRLVLELVAIVRAAFKAEVLFEQTQVEDLSLAVLTGEIELGDIAANVPGIPN